MPYAVVSAILSEALYFYALSKGELSVSAIILGSYSIYTIIFSFLINNEYFSLKEALFIGLTILGTLIIYLPSKFSFSEIRKDGTIFWPLIAAIGVGLSDTLSKKVIDETGDFTFLFVLALVQIPVALIYLRLEKQNFWKEIREVKSKFYDYKNALAGSLFNIIGTGLLWVSFSQIFASIASPIIATSGAISFVFAFLFLDEKIVWRQLLGLILIFIGITGVSV